MEYTSSRFGKAPRKLFSLAFFIFFLPLPLFAAPALTEIMYDLDGTDTGREWIEVKNTGSSTVDLSLFKFFEGGSNHALVPLGSSLLPAGAYAVIADKPDSFRADHPNFSGLLFDSSFSLSNEGEMLILRDENLVDVDAVTYTSSWGALGNGNSLQLSGGEWIEALPTPGSANATTSTPPAEGSGDDVEITNSSTSSSGAKPAPRIFPQKPFIEVSADVPKKLIAGMPYTFLASGTNEKKQKARHVLYTWNFGDGLTGEGLEVSHQYDFPGTYTVVLRGEAFSLEDEDVVRVVVEEPSIIISEVGVNDGGYVVIKNETSLDQDISGWHLFVGGSYHTFPENTRVSSGAEMVISLSRVELPSREGSEVILRFPSGDEVSRYVRERERVLTHAPASTSSNAPKQMGNVQMRDVPEEDFSFLNTERAPQAASQLAALSGSSDAKGGEKRDQNIPVYVFIVLLVAAVLAILFIPQKKRVKSEVDDELTADDFEITEVLRD